MKISRRSVLVTTGLAGLGLWPRLAVASEPPIPTATSRVLRLAHLTDVHVQPERHAGDGLATCLRHVMSLPDRPQLILTGGDAIMDSFEADNTRTQLQWDLWKKVLADECDIPMRHAIGNHDVWGINRSKSHTTGQEVNFGKKRAVENFGISDRYYSFDQAGWRFIVLDSTFPQGDGYISKFDDEQHEWLVSILDATPSTTPVLILSHMPILSVTPVAEADVRERKGWDYGGSLMHVDWPRLRNLFRKHRNVKACLSGHTHLLEKLEYAGVTFICGGAVSGNWWKGPRADAPEGYNIIDLYADGSLRHEYVAYGWTAQT